ncbi:hypothetical protein D0809_20905 [Flavobacterium circumlabens]|uniref:Antimicrobial peptide system SdpB family protein n=1 Tax=Flavobacterium circumlabens TaxID=2133765 RepID=A0A4Y7U7D7_9FLAO|nr:sporulation-delaying protein SdpB family protein [Flavobacterium circumlabens]TCN53089.1 antimicrobial peptide system SdpB family protein [Flavobacterium circumlabens]TEB42357.1 hypothetical protein D0809_20905 [Flavobacterium circumlabens]
MISKQLNVVESLINKNYWFNWLGLSRTIIASALILTLLCNSKYAFFFTGYQNENCHKFGQYEFNFFSFFNDFQTGIYFALAGLLLVASGIFPRYTCVLHWFISYSFSITSSCTDGGYQVASILTMLLIPICIFDKRRWHWSEDTFTHSYFSKVTVTFAFYMISLQVFTIYFFASVGKFKVEEWKNGTALYYWFTQPLFGGTIFFKPFIDLLLSSPVAATLLNWSVLVIELLIALSIFILDARKKKVIISLGILFHFFIGLFMGIVSFSFVMCSALLILISNNVNYEFRIFNFPVASFNFSSLLLLTAKKNK